jgi:hypothetical protein
MTYELSKNPFVKFRIEYKCGKVAEMMRNYYEHE